MPPRTFAELAAESALLVGGARAILLQLAHPAVGHGVADHSDFDARPLSRLHGTLDYLYALALGTPDDVDAMRRRVNRAHAPVRSAAGEQPAYSAFDPDLQRWVAATLADTTIRVHERVWGALDAAAAEEVVHESARIGSTLQQREWFDDRAAFDAWFAARMPELAVDDTTRRVARTLLAGAGLPWIVRRTGMPVVRLLTADLLGPELRAAFGMRFTPTHARRAERVWRVGGAVYRRLPVRVRTAPARVSLRRIRRAAHVAR